MKRAVSLVLVASMLSFSTPAWADVTLTVPDIAVQASAVITPLVKSQPAPYPGILFSAEAIAKVIAKSDADAAIAKLALQDQVDVDAAKLKFQVEKLTTTCTADKGDLQAQVDDGKRQITILNDELKKTSSPFISPGGWFGIGVAGGVVATILTVFAVSKVTK